MAPSHSRQLLAWTLPTIAVLLSYLWYKKKRIGARSDPGDKFVDLSQATTLEAEPKTHEEKSSEIARSEAGSLTPEASPSKSFSRSLSGVDSSPIDIVIPRELRLGKPNPVVISDEDLDVEIEKVKSMKSGNFDIYRKSTNPNYDNNNTSALAAVAKSKTPSPKSEIVTPFKCKNKKGKNLKQSKVQTNMAQKEASDSCEKMTPLELDLKDTMPPKSGGGGNKQKKSATAGGEDKENAGRNDMIEKEDLQRQSSERDSANHSPADVMLASPSLSSISDNHSEGSNDSGKGGSDVVTPPPSRTLGTDESVDLNMMTKYEFLIPQTLVGKLIGKHGTFVTQINHKTQAHIVVRKHTANNKMKVCCVEGNQKEIDKALKMIRERFPLKKFPEVTLERVSFVTNPSTFSLISDTLYLKLIEGINNDTIISCMVSPNHLFLQQPTHPSFLNLNILTTYMNHCYSEVDSPLLPSPIPDNTVCVAYSVDSWYRAIVLSTDLETETSYVKFLDYGGFAYVENSQLKQIRGDFMLLPFQAAECCLANVKPIGENEFQWADEAYNLVADLTKGAIVYTQVADYTNEGVPLVNCYVVVGPQQLVFLNQELVNHGYAEWIPLEDSCGEEEGAVGGEV